MKPNFLILGAAKSGTTSLYYYLSQHPEIHMSTPKEPRFFELEYEKGLDFYWQTYFKGWTGQKVVGEASPRNLYLPYIPKHIKQDLPNAKLIVIFRNPVDRAYSAWWMQRSFGKEKLSFEEALDDNLKRLKAGILFDGEEGEQLWRDTIQWGMSGKIKYRWYLDMGYYAQHLNRYLALFPRSQIKIIFFEDLCQNPQAVFTKLCHFLEIDPDFSLKDSRPQMVAIPKIAHPLLKLSKKTPLMPKRLPAQLGSRLKRLLSKFGNKPAMKQETRAWLVDHFADHNCVLESIVRRDLSHWNG